MSEKPRALRFLCVSFPWIMVYPRVDAWRRRGVGTVRGGIFGRQFWGNLNLEEETVLELNKPREKAFTVLFL